MFCNVRIFHCGVKWVMDLKKVARIPQKYRDLVKGYTRKAQTLFPDDSSYYNIVDLIIHLILLYFYHFIESQLLSEDEKDKLLDLLIQNDKSSFVDSSWKLIFSSYDYGTDMTRFADVVYDKTNIMIIVEVDGNAIVGAYTKTGWKKFSQKVSLQYIMEFETDREAFLFYLKSPGNYLPFISNVKQDNPSIKCAVGYLQGYWAVFGNGCIFFINNHGDYTQFDNPSYSNFEAYNHGHKYLVPENELSDCKTKIEVFQILE